MTRSRLFLDSGALFAGVVSPAGAARALLLLAEAGIVEIVVSEQVVVETEHALARALPHALGPYREALRRTGLRIQRPPSPDAVRARAALVRHSGGVPILVATIHAKVDYFVTLDRRHFIDDPRIAMRAGLRIGTPGDALAWVRAQSATR
jgi:predicted nucleic acid-binding protein